MNFEEQYRDLVALILREGIPSTPTKGTVFNYPGYTLVLDKEIPLLTTRKIYYEGVVGELKAFIGNASTQKEFVDKGCSFWGAWANEDGSLDVDYARLLHDFNGVNQLERVINSLRTQAHSRKHVISLWDPSSNAKQVPCVLSYQWIVNGDELDMVWTQRSTDVAIGLPSDMLSAWLFNIYEEHVEGMQELIRRLPMQSAGYLLTGDIYDFDLKVVDYAHQEPIRFRLCV
jgi:thymidylate synthase